MRNGREIAECKNLERNKRKINKKEKTIQQQKGLLTLSADLNKEKTIQQQKGLSTMSADLNHFGVTVWFKKHK